MLLNDETVKNDNYERKLAIDDIESPLSKEAEERVWNNIEEVLDRKDTAAKEAAKNIIVQNKVQDTTNQTSLVEALFKQMKKIV